MTHEPYEMQKDTTPDVQLDTGVHQDGGEPGLMTTRKGERPIKGVRVTLGGSSTNRRPVFIDGISQSGRQMKGFCITATEMDELATKWLKHRGWKVL